MFFSFSSCQKRGSKSDLILFHMSQSPVGCFPLLLFDPGEPISRCFKVNLRDNRHSDLTTEQAVRGVHALMLRPSVLKFDRNRHGFPLFLITLRMPIRLFGKKKEAPKADNPVTRSEELGRQIMDLDLRVQQLDKVIAQEKMQGKAAMQAKNKAKALRHVKRVKVIEKQQQHVYKLIENYQVQQDKIQEAVTNIEYITQAKKNQQAIEQMFAAHGLSPDAAEEVIDDVQEQFARLDEFTAALDRDIGSPVDDGEISDELAQWEAELQDEEQTAAPAAPARATGGRAPAAAATEDDEMAALMGAFS
jgi:hypothetical protein